MPVLPRLVTRTFLVVGLLAVVRWALISLTSRPTTTKRVASREIQRGSLVDRIRGEKNLDTHKYPFLQARMGQFTRSPALPVTRRIALPIWPSPPFCSRCWLCAHDTDASRLFSLDG
jgi:hypothetical protein